MKKSKQDDTALRAFFMRFLLKGILPCSSTLRAIWISVGIMLGAAILQSGCLKKRGSLRASTHTAESKTHDETTSSDDGAGVLNQDPELPLKVDAGNLRGANSEIFIDAQSSGASAWHWEQLAGPGTINFKDPDAEDTALTADGDGVYWLRLTVSNVAGKTAYDDVEVVWDTQAPEMRLTPEIRTFQSITVDGGVSSDATLIEWTQVSGPGQISYSSPKTSATTISASLDGTYTLQLKVADALGNTRSAEMIFIWETTLPSVSLGQDLTSNKELALDGAANRAISYTWTQVSGPGMIAFSSANTEDTKVSASQDGAYVLRLTIVAANGATAYDELTLNWDTSPPLVELGQDLFRKYRATIDAQTKGASVYKWSMLSGPGKLLFSSPSSEDTSLVVDLAGDYEVELSVTDLAGNVAKDKLKVSIELDFRVFAKQVSSGGSHSCAILDDSSVACWGYNYEQELGYGDENRYGEGSDRYMPPSFPVNIGAGKYAVAISVNYGHSCAILNDGSVKCWGQNSAGQLGYGDTNRRGMPAAAGVNLGAARSAQQIATGTAHTCVILDDASVMCWGGNYAGQLGYGDYMNRLAPSQLPVNLGPGRTAKALSLGAYHTCALLDNASVKCWGENSYGQLGYGDLKVRSTPDALALKLGEGSLAEGISSGSYHSCAVLKNGEAKCWGRNNGGQLGYSDTLDRLAPEASPIDFAGSKVQSLTGGLDHSCALMQDASVQCWGGNQEGQLGYGPGDNKLFPPQASVPLSNDRLVKSLAAGRLHTCAVLDDATLKCWGSNAYGQLGRGKIVDGSVPPPDVIGYGD